MEEPQGHADDDPDPPLQSTSGGSGEEFEQQIHKTQAYLAQAALAPLTKALKVSTNNEIQRLLWGPLFGGRR